MIALPPGASTVDAMTDPERETIVYAPATGQPLASIPNHSNADIQAAAARARAAQPAWAAAGFSGRGEVLAALAHWLTANIDRAVSVICAETGKTRDEPVIADIQATLLALSHWRRQAPRLLADQRVRSHAPAAWGKRLVIHFEPRGVIGVIGPWNYPMANSFADAVPALAAGNAVLLKPSEVTPLTSLMIAQAWREIGAPADVFQVVTGAGESGAALVDHVDMVMFPGSTATGRKIAARCGERLIPYALELGGKDAMVVLADADLERAANCAVTYGMMNAGQLCISIERVYVEDAVHDHFVELVAAKTRALRWGPPGAAGSIDVGAITHLPQVDIIERHLNDSLKKGARTVAGGTIRRDGEAGYVEPTVLVDCNHDMEIMRDETFGPMLPIMRVRDADEAVALANDSEYGLAGCVFTSDLKRGEQIARDVISGHFSVNDAFMHYAIPELPFGGVKNSGIGVRHGAEGIQKYCRRHTFLVARRTLRREPHFLPYAARRTRIIRRALKLCYGRTGRAIPLGHRSRK